jgi:hypothetical protein
MLYASIALFALAAVIGATMLMKWMAGQGASKTVIYSHGLVAATALVLLIVYYVQHPDDFPMAALWLFVIGAVGGFYLFFVERQGKRPIAIAVLHGLLGISGFIALLAFVLK